MFPAVSLRESYSRLPPEMVAWWSAATSPDWPAARIEALSLLDEAARAEATARLVGADSLPEKQQWLLEVARLFEDGFLRQNAFDPADAYCSPMRQFKLLSLLLGVHRRGVMALERGAGVKALARSPQLERVARAKTEIAEDHLDSFGLLVSDVERAFAALEERSPAGGLKSAPAAPTSATAAAMEHV